jgi:hypothetical protein
LKKRLIEECERSRKSSVYTNIVGEKLEVDPSHQSPSQGVKKWVEGLIRNRYSRIENDKAKFNLDIRMWFAKYGKGDYAKIHDHIPHALFAFVYFVNAPRGSSPLVFTTSGKRIKAEEGKVVIFPSMILHGVSKNKSENRITLSGNVLVR